MTDYTEFDREVIYEYEQVLIGNLRTIDKYYFSGRSSDTNSRTALMLIRYVTETYLQWSPQKLCDCLTIDILKKWKLTGYLKYIQYPDDLHKERNLWYIAHLIYPQQIPVNDKDICVRIYSQLLSGQVQKFPKGFFSGASRMNRVCYCLDYAIDHYTNFKSVEEMYEFFGTPLCVKFLRQYNLYSYMRETFETPVVALYLILPKEQDIPFLFQYYRFWQAFNEAVRKEGETRGAKAKFKHRELDKEATKYVQVNLD